VKVNLMREMLIIHFFLLLLFKTYQILFFICKTQLSDISESRKIINLINSKFVPKFQ